MTRIDPLRSVSALVGLIALLLFFGGFRDLPVHDHDLFHYVIGGKYFDYLGYRGIYAATATAMEEQGRLPDGVEPRDLTQQDATSSPQQWRRLGQEVKQRMGAENWGAFTQDILFFDARLSGKGIAWKTVLEDHGFNPSPAWVFWGTPLLSLFSFPAIYDYLPLIDYLLLFLSCGAVTFAAPKGARRVTFAAFWIGLNLLKGSDLQFLNWTGGSYLRYSWFCMLSVGVAAMLRRRHFAAGAFIAAAGLERIFPFVFLAGMGLVLAVEAGRAECFGIRRILPGLKLAGGAAAVTIVFLLLVAYSMPSGRLAEFAGNIGTHAGRFSANAVGLKKLAVYSPEIELYRQWQLEAPPKGQGEAKGGNGYRMLLSDLMSQRLAQNRWFLWVGYLISVVAAIVALRFMPGVSAGLHIGVLAIFLLTLISHYYLAYFAIFLAVSAAEFLSSPAGRRFGAVPTYWAVFVTACIYISNIQGTEMFRTSMLSFAMLVFLWALPLCHTPYRLARWFAFVPGLLLGVAILGVNGRIASPEPPPVRSAEVLLAIGGEELRAANPSLPPIRQCYADTRGKNICDAGAILFEGGELDIDADFSGVEATRVRLILRTDLAYPVSLGVAVNGERIGQSLSLDRVGGLFTYTYTDLPAQTLKAGPIRLRITLDRGIGFALYHLWIVRD